MSALQRNGIGNLACTKYNLVHALHNKAKILQMLKGGCMIVADSILQQGKFNNHHLVIWVETTRILLRVTLQLLQ